MARVLRDERRGRVAVLTLDRPERLNAIGSDTVALLHHALDRVESDREVRAIVITGEGRAFSAGADISELDGLETAADFARFVTGLADVFDRLAACATPSIAAINGIAFGGGCELALACDLRLAAPTARLGVPEVKLGLLPAAEGTQRLARLLPSTVAKHMLMTGVALDADRALALGLVNGIDTDVVEAALALAGTLGDGPPLAISAAKHLVDAGPALPFAEAVTFERSTVAALFDTDDRREGLAAFKAKRAPVFTGR